MRTAGLLRKELVQIRRDRSLFGLLIVAPLLQLLVLGFAITTDVREVKLAVRDFDRSMQSREYVRALSASDYFKTTYVTAATVDDARLLVSGRAGLVLVIPRGFAASLERMETASVQVLVDGADVNSAIQGLNYLQRATRLFSSRGIRLVEEDIGRRTGTGLPTVSAECRAWFNPGLMSRFYMVPGLIGVLLMITTMVVNSMALVKEREQGTMEQLIVTPLRPAEIILGKLLPFVVIGFIEVTLLLIGIKLIFNVPLRGSVLTLYAFSGMFLMTTLGLGLFVSTVVRTQQQAMMFAMFFVMMPFMLLSGFIFPVENMPLVIQPLAHMIPLKYYLTAVRGLYLKGNGWFELWPSAAALLAWGTVILTISVLKFRKRLD